MLYKRLKSFVLLTLIAVTSGLLFGLTDSKKYLWPLKINNGISSTFLEFRSNHFHGGIDLRTFQKTGYPVHAISDGYIYQIRQVKRGGGKGLYLKHSDGFVSKYFHLDRFNSKLNSIANRVRIVKKQKYFGNYFLDQKVFVKKGDLIGYSGETGSGFAHLHLEIRDQDDIAVNPFDLIDLPGIDRNVPVFKSAIVRNDDYAIINNQVGEFFLTFKKVNKNTYRSSQKIYYSDSFELILNAYDISDTGRYVAPYQLTANINDKSFFNLKCEKFQWNDNNQLGFVYDMQYSSSSSPFFNLFSQNGYQLESFKTKLNLLLKDLSYGEHSIKIIIKDYFGNTSIGLIPLIHYKKPVLELADIIANPNSIDFTIKKLSDDFSDKIQLKLLDSSGIEQYSALLEKLTNEGERFISLKNFNYSNICYLVWEFFYQGKVYFQECYSLKNQKPIDNQKLNFKVFVNNDLVYLKLIDFKGNKNDINLGFMLNGAEKTIQPEPGRSDPYFVLKMLDSHKKFGLKFRILNQNELKNEIERFLDIICLKPLMKQSFHKGSFFAEFESRTVKNPKVLLYKKTDFNSEFSQISEQVELYPYNFPFLDKVLYGFKIPQGIHNTKQLGIFKYNQKNKKWYYKYSILNTSRNSYTTKVLHSGVFALMRDDYPPGVSLLKVRSRYLRYLKHLSVKITDKGKGVDDRFLKIVINGEKNNAEYDPDWKIAHIADVSALKKGLNVIRVSVRDYGSNTTEKIFKINLK